MIVNLSIWLPPDLYSRLPILLPYVVRDPSCRKAVNKKTEEWGSCNSGGYFRDDNTLIKAIPRTFRIRSKNKSYAKKKMSKGFVASHIWRKLNHRNELSSRYPLTNTFVPNLVWLPRQLSKLTDREGSFAQKYIQALSIHIFKNIKIEEKRKSTIEKIWDLLPEPNIETGQINLSNLNVFSIQDQDISKMTNKVLNNIELIKESQPSRKLYCSRYFMTYSKLPEKVKTNFTNNLDEYAKIIR
jgi:hypothetical protein